VLDSEDCESSDAAADDTDAAADALINLRRGSRARRPSAAAAAAAGEGEGGSSDTDGGSGGEEEQAEAVSQQPANHLAELFKRCRQA
jgi:hypothetical protein